MEQTNFNIDPRYGAHPVSTKSHGCAVSWAAILGGAFVAIGISLVLAMIGSGLGLSFASPYSGDDFSMAEFTIKTAIWLIIMQWLASGLGGYVAGRLRNRWEGLHGDEVFFRDTAHGLVSWCVATVITVCFLTSALSSVAGTATHAAATVTAAKVSEENTSSTGGPFDQYVDTLFRTTRTNMPLADETVRNETARIIMKDGEVSAEDQGYLSQLVASRTGVPLSEAESRVSKTMSDVKTAKAEAVKAADEARKTAAKFSILTALSMLIGAFIAGVAAAIGGRDRDEY